jgi:hypothetical protein
MDLTTVARRIARLEYAAVRLPFGLLEDHFIARYRDEDAPIRVGFENLLGSLDEFAGRLLDDEEMRRRGQALRRETGSGKADGAAGPEAASPWAQAAADGAASEPPDVAITPAVPPEVATPSGVAPGTVDVIFTLPADVDAERVALCGDFNDWSADTIGCARTEDGTWQAIVALAPGRSYRYRYLLDGERWENARQADRYLPNPFGGVDSVVVVE